jgi:hypothetical protein
LYERNLRRRFGRATLPLVRISENIRRDYQDFDRTMVIRDLFGAAADRDWARNHPDEPFIHYRNHYESLLENARLESDLDQKANAIFTEGISGGNYTNTLIRAAIDRFTYLGIVEAALTRIAIIDERIFDKCRGRHPGASKAERPDDPRWFYWEHKGIYILNSDETGVFDLWGDYISTGVVPSIVYDFVSVHLGLIDKVASGEKTTERDRLQVALARLGGRYQPGHSKLSIHSGRGGLAQMSDGIAFVSLSGIEWAMDNCKFQLAEFFHGIKYPPFVLEGEPIAGVPFQVGNVLEAKRIAPDSVTARRPAPSAPTTKYEAPPAAPPPDDARKIFVVTTYAFDHAHLYGAANGHIETPDIEDFAKWDHIRRLAPARLENFKRIAHIDSTVFFYPCAKADQRVIIPPERHQAYIIWLVGRILEAKTGDGEVIDLHLILHASDVDRAPRRLRANTYDQDDQLIDALKWAYPKQIVVSTIWWFSHDGRGIHGRILTDGAFFARIDDKSSHLLAALHRLTNRPWPGAALAADQSAVGDGQDDFPCRLRLPADFHMTNRDFLNRLAIWQLSGAVDQAALVADFFGNGGGKSFWQPEFSPETSGERLKNPRPLLVLGAKSLDELEQDERRARYLDSGIWCRYATSADEEKAILQDFEENRRLGLYDSNNGKEYLEFWARMLVNARIGKFDGSGHDIISPIVFHSEGEMARKVERMLVAVQRYFAAHPATRRPLTWKILLLDDHAKTRLSGADCTKLDLLCHRLAPIFPIEVWEEGGDKGAPHAASSAARPALDGLTRVNLHYVASKDEALRRIKRERFDLILLDYLLKKGEHDGFETSDQLLEALKKSGPDTQVFAEERGPLRQLWFSNVSAFALAVEGKMAAKGLPYHLLNRWEMNKGSCPLNTPELFRYNLLRFMELQLTPLTLFFGSRDGENGDGPQNLIGLLRAIYLSKKETARRGAIRWFQSLLKLRDDCASLRADLEYGMENEADRRRPEKIAANLRKSEIVFSLFPDIVHYTPTFWDHLIHLVYHTAHGSPQDWPRMLVHFKEIKEILRRAAGSDGASVEELLGGVEGYIIGLHGNSHRER